jgi:hypothetical protein
MQDLPESRSRVTVTWIADTPFVQESSAGAPVSCGASRSRVFDKENCLCALPLHCWLALD